MSRRPWMPLYVGDYLADTQHLTTTQHGAYLLLLMHYWHHGKLPTDEAAIAGISRLNRDQWRSNCRAIAGMFEPGWKHHRVEKEIEKANAISEKRAMAGRKGADRTNHKVVVAFPANDRQMPTHSQSHIESYLEPEPSLTPKAASDEGSKLNGSVNPELAALVRRKGWTE
jgi:uncharacterized protein YdaU (DUF1376 family)